MAESPSKFLSLEIYVAQVHEGYAKLRGSVVVTDGHRHHGYGVCATRDIANAESFYKHLVSSLEQKRGDVELHCNGSRSEITINKIIGGKFGKPGVDVSYRMFTRKLTKPEICFLRAQFNRLQGDGLRILLVD